MSKIDYKVLIPISNPPKTYLNALKKVGLTPVCNFETTNVDSFCGLLLTGGGDIYPTVYDSRISFKENNLFRDFREIETLNLFTCKNLPVLGICRGLQIINVFFGGTLKQVDNHSGFCKDVYHNVITPYGGFLDGVKRVNSSHCQAVDSICPDAKEICYALDGTIEGFKLHDFLLAVQFHPERLDNFVLSKVFGEFLRLIKS